MCVCSVVVLGACSYTPLKEKEYRVSQKARVSYGVKATFYGNTTIHITDGETHLLVDGFFSRPGVKDTLFGYVKPDYYEIKKWLKRARIKKLDAVLVGHTHGDHALDAPLVSELTGAKVMGSRSYQNVHASYGANPNNVILVSSKGGKKKFGQFTVRFLESDHIRPTTCYQHKLEGKIEKSFSLPAKFSDFKCGNIYALHISHPKGNFAITTSAAAVEGQWKRLEADVLFLGVGLLSRVSARERHDYWRQGVDSLSPKTLVPVHWDSFMRPLDQGLKPPPAIFDSVRKTMSFVKRQVGASEGIQLRVMDIGDSIYLPTTDNGR